MRDKTTYLEMLTNADYYHLGVLRLRFAKASDRNDNRKNTETSQGATEWEF
ncbi:MAG: hypothetical protein AAGI69_12220 [Cyanobacteria bacterium P01_H01_bin.21]